MNGINFLKIRIFGEKLNLKTNYSQTYNILSLIAVIYSLKLNLKHILKKLEKIEPSEGRGKIYSIKRFNINFKLIDESYNANPFVDEKRYSKFFKNKERKF